MIIDKLFKEGQISELEAKAIKASIEYLGTALNPINDFTGNLGKAVENVHGEGTEITIRAMAANIRKEKELE